MPATNEIRTEAGCRHPRSLRPRAGRTRPREQGHVVVCDADLSKSTMTTYFAKEFPDRFF